MLDERRHADELMDDPTLDPETYSAVVEDLAKVNRLTLAYRPTLDFLDRVIGERCELRLLDVGFGNGDMLRRISHWARRRGIEARLVGIDLNSRSLAAATAATPASLGIDYRIGNYAELSGERFDYIVSSLVTHHMTARERIDFLGFMESEARLGWFVNDLHRHGVAYVGWPLLARMMGWHRIVRHDGHVSIARAFRPAEWKAMLAQAGIEDAQVARYFPFRLCVEQIR